MPGNVLHALYDARADAAATLCPPDAPVWTTADMRAAIGRHAAALRALGVGRGGHVSFMLAKSPRAVVLAHACLALGAVMHPLDPALTDDEAAALLADARPRLIVCAPAEAARLAAFATAPVETLDGDGGGSLGERAAASVPESRSADVAGDATAALLYTSGTTGRPKGARITHANLAESARALAAVWRLGPGDVLLHALPVTHAHGLFTALNTLLVAGGSVLFLPRFEAGEVAAALPEATVMMGVPTHYARLLREPTFTAPPRLRLAISGSAPLPGDVDAAFMRATGLAIRQRYGLTEAAIIAAVPADAEARPGWVGWPLPGVEMRVRDEDGAARPRGLGALETRGPHVFAGYLRRPEADRAAITDDGWFRTGDIAEIDSTGCLRIVDRAKDLVITGGVNVFPGEVEAVLAGIDGVAGTAVVGVPHPDFGEAVVAAVEIEAGAPFDEVALIGAVRARLSGTKTPKRVFAVAEIPRNRMGKILKHALRERFQATFEKETGHGPEP